MALIQPPSYLQGVATPPQYSAEDDRQYLTTSDVYKDSVDASRAKGGLLPNVESWKAQVTVTDMTVTISPFRAIVQHTIAADSGDYRVVNTDSVDVVLSASSPTENRIDIIGVQVEDEFYAGSENRVRLVAVEGTPTAGTPSLPSTPNNFLELYHAEVDAGVTEPTLVDVRRNTAHAGAAYVPYTHELSDSGSYPGELRIAPSQGSSPARIQFWLGSDWSNINQVPQRAVFESDGTWNKPLGASFLRVRVQAAGGGGGGAVATSGGESSGGGGGGGGAYAESWLKASDVGGSETVDVGGAGLVSAGGNGGDGGDSSFGTHVIALGGIGGSVSSARGGTHMQAGANGGQGGTGQVVVTSRSGSPAIMASGGTTHSFRNVGGSGGDSTLGSGGRGAVGGTGASATGFGGGGGGSSNHQNESARFGGFGHAGVIIVDTYF